MTLGDASKVGRLAWSGVWLPLAVALMEVEGRENDFINKVMFVKQSHYLTVTV
jgi:hypothetical protein